MTELADPPVDAAFGIHICSDLPVGTIAAAARPVMAAVDEFRVTLRGTVRIMHPALLAEVPDLLRAMIGGIAQAMGCAAEIGYERRTPPLVNNAALSGVELLDRVARAYLG